MFFWRFIKWAWLGVGIFLAQKLVIFKFIVRLTWKELFELQKHKVQLWAFVHMYYVDSMYARVYVTMYVYV